MNYKLYFKYFIQFSNLNNLKESFNYITYLFNYLLFNSYII